MASAAISEDALPSLPATRRAIIQRENGKPLIAQAIAMPTLKPRTILVSTRAVALNPSDFKMGAKFPSQGSVVGMDYAGTIVRIDPEAAQFRPELEIGDLICGLVHGSNPADRENGSFAEYVVVPAELVIKVPKNMRLEKAATLGVSLAINCLALWESLQITATPDSPSEKPYDVLVYGGSTACGTMAIQLLRLSGLNPITTCSRKNFPLVKSYGAGAAFEYMSPDTPQAIRTHTSNRLHYALDCITDTESVACCYAALGRTGGRYASLELCPEALQTRKAVKAEFVMGLEIFGRSVELDSGYERPPNTRRYEAGVHWFQVFQRLLNESKLKSHPVKVLEGGLESVLKGLQMLRTGVSGEKLVTILP